MGREGSKIIPIKKGFIPILDKPVLRKRASPKKPVEEKRKDHRHTLSLDTEVHLVKQEVEGMFRCCTRNIGLHGAFIPSAALPVESSMFVEVVFKSKEKQKPCMTPGQYRLQAQVIHTSNLGAGLVFKIVDTAQQRDFRRFLYKAKLAERQGSSRSNIR